METIKKSIGQGWGSGPLYYAMAYDANDKYGGMAQKQVRYNPTSGKTAVIIGDSTTAVTLATYAQRAISIYTTCASTDASNEVLPIFLHAKMTGALGIGRGMEVELSVYNVRLGAHCNAIKGYTNFETTGMITGLGSAICAEMKMPGGSVTHGTYAAMEIEVVCPSSWAGAQPTNFIWMQVSGNTKANFDTYGNLFTVKGLTSGSGKLLYNSTLRCLVGTTTWYLPLSSTEGKFTTAYRITGTYSGGIGCYLNVAATVASRYGLYSLITATYTTGGAWAVYGDITWSHATSGYPTLYGVCGRATVNDNYTGGTGYVYAVSGQLHFTNDTIINSAASVFAALCGVITSDATPTLTTGHITCLYLDNLCNDVDLADTAGVNSFIYMANNSGGKDMDDAIYLYGPDVLNFIRFQGCTSIVSSTYTTPLHGTLCKKIKISLDGTTYYLLASTTISD